MKINLTDFLDETVKDIAFDEVLELDTIDTGKRVLHLAEPVKVSGHIYKIEGIKYLTSDISFKYIENCARCLKKFTQTINTVLSGELKEKSEGNFDLDDADNGLIFYEGNELKLKEKIIDTMILSLPMKSLCKEDCKGLCLKCGQDLNKEECDCVIENIDPRLAKLKEFFE